MTRPSCHGPDGERGLEVSQGCFFLDQLFQGQIADRPTKTPTLRLQGLRPLDLNSFQSAELGTPSILRKLSQL